MKKNYLFTFVVLFMGLQAANAQQSTTASGGTASGAGGSATYTIGQVAYSRISSSGGSVGEGVQQPYEFLIGIDEINGISVTMTLFPNPSSSMVNVKIDSDQLKDVSYILSDMLGRILLRDNISARLTSIALDKFESGNYELTILNKKEKVKSFQITKTN